MQIAFRVDASLQIGSGHLMRCLTLANKLKENGDNCTFFCRHLPDNLRSMIQSNGHQFKLLKNNQASPVVEENYEIADLAHSAWLGVSQTQDAHDTIAAMQLQIVDWLVVDHYALDFRWQALLRSKTKHILVIDDLADRTHDCDALLDQNFYVDMATRYISRVPAHCQLLLGPTFALLRPEFAKARQTVKPRTGKVQRIFVFFGGMDADNVTGQALAALRQIDLKGIAVDVVIGAQHPARQTIVADCLRLGFTCHVQTDNMAALMAMADLAIGAGGSATWERCCLGLPTITLVLAENQRQLVVDGEQQGFLLSSTFNDLGKTLVSLLQQPKKLAQVSHLAMSLVGGDGAFRILTKLGMLEINVRCAEDKDSKDLFNWRNHPTIRAASYNQELIAWDAHQLWLSSVLTNPERVLLIGEWNGEKLGVVRYDLNECEAEISIYLNPDASLRGTGSDLMKNAEFYLLKNYTHVDTVIANVLPVNIVSHQFFSNNGFSSVAGRYIKRLKS